MWCKTLPKYMLNVKNLSSINPHSVNGLLSLIGGSFAHALCESEELLYIYGQIASPNLAKRTSPNTLIFEMLNSIPIIPQLNKILPISTILDTLEPFSLPAGNDVTFDNGSYYTKEDIKNQNKVRTLVMDPITDNTVSHLQRLDPEELMKTRNNDDTYIYAMQRDLFTKRAIQTVMPIQQNMFTNLAIMLPSIESGLSAQYTVKSFSGNTFRFDSAYLPSLSPALHVIREICSFYKIFPILDREGIVHVPLTISQNVTTTLPLLITQLLNSHMMFMSGMLFDDNIAQIHYIAQLHTARAPDAAVLDLKDITDECMTYVGNNVSSGTIVTVDKNVQIKKTLITGANIPTEVKTLVKLNAVTRKRIQTLLYDKSPITAARRVTQIQSIVAEGTFINGDLSAAIEKSGNVKANVLSSYLGTISHTVGDVPVKFIPHTDFEKLYHYMKKHISAGVIKTLDIFTTIGSTQSYMNKLTSRSQGVKVNNTTQRYMGFIYDPTFLHDELELNRLVNVPNVATGRYQVRRRARNIQAVSNPSQYVYLPIYEILTHSLFPHMALDDTTGTIFDYSDMMDDTSENNTLCSYADVKGMDASWHGSLMIMIYCIITECLMAAQQDITELVAYPPFSTLEKCVYDTRSHTYSNEIVAPVVSAMMLATNSLVNLVTKVKGRFGIELDFTITLASGMLPTSILNSLASLIMNFAAYDTSLCSPCIRIPNYAGYTNLKVLGDDQKITIMSDVTKEAKDAIAKSLDTTAANIGFAIDAASAPYANTFLMKQAICGIISHKPQQPTAQTMEYSYWNKTIDERLAAVSSGALELAARMPYFMGCLSYAYFAMFNFYIAYTRHGYASRYSHPVQQNRTRHTSHYKVYPSIATYYLHPQLRRFLLPQRSSRYVMPSFTVIPSSTITSFLFLSQFFPADDDDYIFDDIPLDVLHQFGYQESLFLIQRESKHMIARSRPHRDTARSLYEERKDLLRNDTVVRSDIALTKLFTLSNSQSGKGVPWSKIVPPGSTARENVQQKLLFAFSKMTERAEDIDSLDNLSNLVPYDKLRIPDWWTLSTITCRVSTETMNEHSDTALITSNDALITYLSRTSDSSRFLFLRRLGLMKREDLISGSTVIEKWSKGNNAKELMLALRVAYQYQSSIPNIMELLFDAFGIPKFVRMSIEQVLSSEGVIPLTIDFSPISKISDHLNTLSISNMKGVTTNGIMFRKISRDKSDSTVAAFYSMFHSNSGNNLYISYSDTAVLAYHGLSPQEWQKWLTDTPSEKVTQVKKMLKSSFTNDLMAPISESRLSSNGKEAWRLYSKPETVQWRSN